MSTPGPRTRSHRQRALQPKLCICALIPKTGCAQARPGGLFWGLVPRVVHWDSGVCFWEEALLLEGWPAVGGGRGGRGLQVQRGRGGLQGQGRGPALSVLPLCCLPISCRAPF